MSVPARRPATSPDFTESEKLSVTDRMSTTRQHGQHGRRSMALTADVRAAFSDRLKVLRSSAGYTQRELEGRVHISAQMLSRYEAGLSNPTYIRLFRLSRYFGVTMANLLGHAPLPDPLPKPVDLPPAENMIAADAQDAVTLGQRIRYLREERQLERQALAYILGVSVWAIGAYETGRYPPDPDRYPLITGFFGLTLDQLFGLDPSGWPEPPAKELVKAPEVPRVGLCVLIDGVVRPLTDREEQVIRMLLQAEPT